MNQSNFKILILTFLTLICTSFAFAQDKFVVFGKFKVETGRLTEGKILIEKNGTKDRVKMVSGSGKFEFKLDYDAEYIMSFSQKGYVTKKMHFKTGSPDERKTEGFAPFEFHVTIFKQYEGIETLIFNQPVGLVQYNPEIEDFDYDKDYTRSILSQLSKVNKAVEEKIKEEKRQEKKKEKEKEKEPPPVKEKKDPPVIAKTPERETEPPKETKQESPPPPTPKKKITSSYNEPPKRRTTSNVVVLHSYTVGEFKYPNLSAYGFVNLGDGAGRREVSKEQFDEYAKKYR